MTAKPFEVQEMYDIRERNYDWESFKYQLPKKYTHSAASFVKSGAIFGLKKNYLDDLQKQKKAIPGPSFYKVNLMLSRPQSGKMDKSKRITISEQAKQQSEKQKIPGPGSYFKRPQSAMTTTYSSSSTKQKLLIQKKHYLNETEYLAGTTPGVGAYNLSQPKHIAGPKLFQRVRKQSSQNEKQNKQEEKKSKPLNTTECFSGTFEWMKKQAKKKDSNFFGRSKRFITESKFEKKPAPNFYKMDSDWLSKTNLLNATHSNSKKSVYYH